MAPQDHDRAIAAARHQARRFYGKHKGTVVDTLDPLNRGRLTALVPEVLGEIPTGWAEPCVPYAGPTSGFFSLPPPGAGVWIEFAAGDVSRPIWAGCFWGAGETPMKPPGNQATWTTKTWRSDTGQTIAFDDVLQEITISDAAGLNAVSIDITTATVTIKGAAKVVVDSQLIQLGSLGAAHPAVFGDRLLAYLNQIVALFNAHTHPGETAAGILPVVPVPPQPMMPTATPSMLSRKILEE